MVDIIACCIIVLLAVIMELLLILGVCQITGWKDDRISEGTVIFKFNREAFTTVEYGHYGKNNIPKSVYYPASYRLRLQGQKNGEIVDNWVECTAEEYQQYKIGDYYKK